MHYVDIEAETLARAIGARVKQERKGRSWTLDQLAAVAGVSRRMLVNVEQGSVNPSVGTLLRLSEALGVSLPALVEPPAPRAAKVIRRGEGAALWTGDRGGQGVLVASADTTDAIELWDWTLAAGEQHVSEPHSDGTRELLHVQDGAATVTVGDDRFDLHAGDALSFHGDVAHSYSNPTRDSTRFSLTVFEPRAGAAHRTELPHA
ncbi:XRE family transcriptional regulator [Brevibacterium sanguinis]|uniref:XRE family transcriptional regulator n=2 Tax=Brevibacterium TaxID=1696 RepID=A0A366IL68_9MICO|nr:XRE family transcriptional regulator [Brevibacterium sanguinis]RBP71508.1 XRE family transcriptional regulator [Brevibacterium celere]